MDHKWEDQTHPIINGHGNGKTTNTSGNIRLPPPLARVSGVGRQQHIQKKWLLMKETWLKGAKQVCKMMKGPQ